MYLSEPTLLRFEGRPKDISPKAYWYHYILGYSLPFDRHDWYVQRESGEVGYFAKQGTSSQNTTRRLMQNSAKEASRGKVSTKKALTGAAALGGAAYMKGRGDGKAEVTERNKTKRKSPPGGQTIQENRRVVSETKLAKGGALKKAPAKAKGLKKLPTEVRNKMGYMYKGGKATKFKPCAGCTSPKTCAKQGCKKKRSK